MNALTTVVLLAAALYLLFIGCMVNTKNFGAAFVYNILPLGIAFACAIVATFRFFF